VKQKRFGEEQITAVPKEPPPGAAIGTPSRHGLKFALPLAIIAAGLAGRSALDKALAIQGGAELVALWAQLATVMEVVVNVAAAGVGTGLVVYVARAAQRERERSLLNEALKIGLKVTFCVALAVGMTGYLLAGLHTGANIPPVLFIFAATAGWIAVVPALVASFWQGQRRHGLMLWLALGSAIPPVLAAVVAPQEFILEAVIASQTFPVVALLLLLGGFGSGPKQTRSHPMRRYVIPGLAIGILGPLSMIAARGSIGTSLSWHEAGVLQALFRVTDWVCAFAGGILSLVHLPRFAAARSDAERELRLLHAAKSLLLPAGVALALLAVVHRPLLEAIYDPSVRASHAAVALFFLGSLVRIASWIPLFALYAMHRTRDIAIGELLSLPLFAALILIAGSHATLELAGAFWLLSYTAYAGYNFHAVYRRKKSPRLV
jgi:O-antigen/teichoic acid export membrane protein